MFSKFLRLTRKEERNLAGSQTRLSSVARHERDWGKLQGIIGEELLVVLWFKQGVSFAMKIFL